MSIANIEIKQGSDFQRTISLSSNGQPLAAGWTANAQMLVDTFANSMLSPLYTFNTNIANGQLTFSMAANVSIGIQPAFYSYDVTITNGTQVIRVEEGIAQVTGGVYHSALI